ncbi:hypothetical protein GGR92_001347 [Spirosoma lacussanchae]
MNLVNFVSAGILYYFPAGTLFLRRSYRYFGQTGPKQATENRLFLDRPATSFRQECQPAPCLLSNQFPGSSLPRYHYEMRYTPFLSMNNRRLSSNL